MLHVTFHVLFIQESSLFSTATESIRSNIRNLREENADITIAQVQDSLASEYLNSSQVSQPRWIDSLSRTHPMVR